MCTLYNLFECMCTCCYRYRLCKPSTCVTWTTILYGPDMQSSPSAEIRPATNVSTILLVMVDVGTNAVNVLPLLVTLQLWSSGLTTDEPRDHANKSLSEDSVTLTSKNDSLEHVGVLSDHTTFPLLEEKGTDCG